MNTNGTNLSLEERVTEHKNPVLFRAKTFAETHPLPDFRESVCIVTGGTTGIGAATCAAFVQAGAKAVYNLDVCIEPESNASTRLHFRFCDVSKPAQLRQTIASIINEEGRIDHLVSNAGIWVGGEAMEDITEAEFDWVVGIGCFFSISSVVGFMKQQEPRG
jgi:NAD(P)-dependent dehydrogenase (short-subunit alcohol dehydrogenase family)